MGTQQDPQVFEGPSPRGRGNRVRPVELHLLAGSIPAWAGKPCSIRWTRRIGWVHPRVGGETPIRVDRLAAQEGSIPAWAGKPPGRRQALASVRVHPRVGGETRISSAIHLLRAGPSPRGRGNPVRIATPHHSPRSIPAWAGKPPKRVSAAGSVVVHPRVGGETWRCGRLRATPRGPSPRGRGNPVNVSLATRYLRSIPAWAGKPPRPGP